MNPPQAIDMGNLISLLNSLKKEIEGTATDKFLELLLEVMGGAFILLPQYRKHIENFKGIYLFKTRKDNVAAAAIFKNSQMELDKNPVDDGNWDTRVTFKDAKALRDYIFSQNQDILDSILANAVEIDGNFNYIYKFSFMSKELLHLPKYMGLPR